MLDKDGVLRSYYSRPSHNDIIWKDHKVKWSWTPDVRCMYMGPDNYVLTAALTTAESLIATITMPQTVYVMDCDDRLHDAILDRMKTSVFEEQARMVQLKQDALDESMALLATPVKIIKQ
ncbi:hypothetical protein MYOV002v2_p0140 [Vibrio phage 144E46.1]|nr:hypothetical protein MYOV002v2_p0140 [Vibrio phage 144E46.1]